MCVICNRAEALLTLLATLWENLVAWAEAYPGLGGWFGAVGSIVAVLAAYLLARWEFHRDQRSAATAHNQSIERFIQVVDGYHSDFRQRALVAASDLSAWVSWCGQLNKPRKRALADLNGIPAQMWPSLQAYLDFKEFATTAFNTENDAGTMDARMVDERVQSLAALHAQVVQSLKHSKVK